MTTAVISARMGLTRKTALIAGGLYLTTFVSIPTLTLYAPAHDRGYITGPGPDAGVMWGGVLEMIVAFACIGTAVVLYPVVKRQNQAVALAFVAARILEAATIVAGVASLLTIVSLRQAGAGADAVVTGQALAALSFLAKASFRRRMPCCWALCSTGPAWCRGFFLCSDSSAPPCSWPPPSQRCSVSSTASPRCRESPLSR